MGRCRLGLSYDGVFKHGNLILEGRFVVYVFISVELRCFGLASGVMKGDGVGSAENDGGLMP